MVEFEEIHWLKENRECTNYGEDTEFKTIADCVAKEQEKIVKPSLDVRSPGWQLLVVQTCARDKI